MECAFQRTHHSVHNLPGGVKRIDMPICGAVENSPAGREERNTEMAGRGDNEMVGGISEEGVWQQHAVRRDLGFDRKQLYAWYGKDRFDPRSNFLLNVTDTPSALIDRFSRV